MLLRKWLCASCGILIGSLVYNGVGVLCWFFGQGSAGAVVQIVVLAAMTLVGVYFLKRVQPMMFFDELFWTMVWFGPAVFALIWLAAGPLLTVSTAESWLLSAAKFIARMVVIPLVGGGATVIAVRNTKLISDR